MLLSREHLPLSSLDLSAPNGEFPAGPGRFFESHIRVLDLEGRLQQAPSILIARSENTRNVYAIERHQNGLYVVCKLGAWVSIEKLSYLAGACYEQRCRSIRTTQTTQTDVAEAPSITPQLHKENKRKRVAIEELQSMIRKRPRAMSVTPTELQNYQIQPQATPPTAAGGGSPSTVSRISQREGQQNQSVPQGLQSGPLDPTTDVQASADDIFQNIRSQYSEALYHSKVSRFSPNNDTADADCSRVLWHTSQRGHCLVLVQRSIWTVTRIWK